MQGLSSLGAVRRDVAKRVRAGIGQRLARRAVDVHEVSRVRTTATANTVTQQNKGTRHI